MDEDYRAREGYQLRTVWYIRRAKHLQKPDKAKMDRLAREQGIKPFEYTNIYDVDVPISELSDFELGYIADELGVPHAGLPRRLLLNAIVRRFLEI